MHVLPLHVNESLSPKHLAFFKSIWNNGHTTENCFNNALLKMAKSVKMYMLKQKKYIPNGEALSDFLNKYPILRETPPGTISTNNTFSNTVNLFTYTVYLF